MQNAKLIQTFIPAREVPKILQIEQIIIIIMILIWIEEAFIQENDENDPEYIFMLDQFYIFGE